MNQAKFIDCRNPSMDSDQLGMSGMMNSIDQCYNGTKWLLDIHMMHSGEGTWKMYLWELYKNGSFYPMRGHIHKHTNRVQKFKMGGPSSTYMVHAGHGT
jgi:hypothetical protein